MKRRKWDAKTKAMIVVQGLKGKPLAEICLEHQISQTQYYQWRDHFLANVHQVFDVMKRRASYQPGRMRVCGKSSETSQWNFKKPKSGCHETGIIQYHRTQSTGVRAYEGNQGRASFLGIQTYVGLPEIR
jgi:hypothetical protein